MCCARCAVELFEKSAPGCFGVIYIDIMMPRMNGWDAARTIRAMNRPDAEIIPIIAMSANAFSEDIMDSRLAGHGYSPGQTAGRSQDDQRLKAVHRRTECRKAAERFVTLCSGQPNKNNRNIAMYSSVPVVFYAEVYCAWGGTIYHYMCLDTCNERCYTVKVGITEETEETT